MQRYVKKSSALSCRNKFLINDRDIINFRRVTYCCDLVECHAIKNIKMSQTIILTKITRKNFPGT